MVIAGTQVHIAAQNLAFTAYHQNHLGMGFVANNAIHHVGTGLLQSVCEFDVGFFVKTRFELDNDGNFLALARRLKQGFHHWRVRAGAIERLANDQYVGITCCLIEKVRDRCEGLKRMVQQQITTPNDVENVATLGQARRPAGNERRKFEIGALDHIEHRHQAREINRAVTAEDIGIL